MQDNQHNNQYNEQQRILGTLVKRNGGKGRRGENNNFSRQLSLFQDYLLNPDKINDKTDEIKPDTLDRILYNNTLDHEIAKNLYSKLFRHQINALPYPWKGNTAILMPTGSGKTELGFWAMLYYRENGKKAFFLAPTLALAKQQYNRFLSLFGGHEKKNVSILTGEINSDKRSYDADYIFATPQTLYNDLVNGLQKPANISIDSISIIVFDEMHNARKSEMGNGHAYYKLSELLAKSSVKILGLTATFGTKRLRKMIIDAMKIKDIKTGNAEIERREIKIYFELDEDMLKLMKSIKAKIDELKDEFEGICSFYKLKMPKSKSERKKIKDMLPNNDIEALKIYWLYDFLNDYYDKLVSYGLRAFLSYAKLKLKTNTGRKVYALLKSDIEKAVELLKKGYEHPKIKALSNYIKNGKKTIIFVNFYSEALVIKYYLDKLNDNSIRPLIFAGRKYMNDREREMAIQKFANGEINTLISTSVAEEGIDISDVDNIIFFEPIPSAIRKIQRSGRARKQGSNVWIFITAGSNEELYSLIADKNSSIILNNDI
ncbi:MAG: DEAD/DEAH box helicase family protein [Candidatus Anstonellales archaeon]